MARLERDLALAYNERMQRSQSFFKGKEVSNGYELSFTTFDSPVRTLIARRSPGILAIRYYLEKEDDGSLTLIRSEAPFNNFERLDVMKGQTIASGILRFEMEFYNAQADQWTKEWDSAAATHSGLFPKAVKIIIESVDRDSPQADWKRKSLRFETKVLILNEIEDR